MKTLLRILPALYILAVPSIRADNRLRDATAGPARPDAGTQAPDSPAMTYDTAETIQSMPRCRGTVVEKFSCCARMTARDGTRFWIGSPAASREVVRFVQTLKEGEGLMLPDAFLAWRRDDAAAAGSAVTVQF